MRKDQFDADITQTFNVKSALPSATATDTQALCPWCGGVFSKGHECQVTIRPALFKGI